MSKEPKLFLYVFMFKGASPKLFFVLLNSLHLFVDANRIYYLSCKVDDNLLILIFDNHCSPSPTSFKILRFSVNIDLFRQRFENCCVKKNLSRQQTAS